MIRTNQRPEDEYKLFLSDVTAVRVADLLGIGLKIPLRFQTCFKCPAEAVFLDIGTTSNPKYAGRPFPERASNQFAAELFEALGGNMVVPACLAHWDERAIHKLADIEANGKSK